jgi:hypothetical protein
MAKLTIYLISDSPTGRIERLYKDKVDFIVAKVGADIPWSDYKAPLYRLPEREWIDNYTEHIYDTHGRDVDGVMFVLNGWENGTRRLNGLQPSFLSNTYDTMFVRHRVGEEQTAFHEIKHLVDNLVRVHLAKKLGLLIGVKDWDDDVVHAEGKKYDFRYRLDEAWVYIEEAIRIRRTYRKLNIIKRLLAEIIVLINSMKEERKDHFTSETGEIDEPIKQPVLSNREKLHALAVSFLGVDASPSDLAPDELGCAESVSNIINALISFPIITGTWTLWDKLMKDARFESVGVPMAGDIIISPTATGNGSIVGHVGIVTFEDRIMSSDSYKQGKFLTNFTLVTWQNRYMKKGGFPVYYFRLK